MQPTLNNTFNNLPLYVMDVNGDLTDDTGVSTISFVASPAIGKTFLKFTEAVELKFSADERRIVSGPIMLADTPLYRCPPEFPEPCYIFYPPEVIERAAIKFASLARHNNVNQDHDGQTVEDIVLYESFLTDATRGVLPMRGYEDAPEGSWFGSFKVNNDEMWERIKAGDFTGFSVEITGFVKQALNPAKMEEVPFAEFCETDEEREKMRQLWEALEESE